MKQKLTILAACVLCLCLGGCGNAGQTYTEYVKAVLDCTYQGSAADYCKLTKASESDAQAIHQAAVQSLSNQLCYQATVDRSVLDAETVAGYDALAASLLSKVKYSASNAVKAGEIYQITISAQPLDFWEITRSDLEQAYTNGFSKAFYQETAGTDSYRSLEAAWGTKVLEVYNQHIEEAGNLETCTFSAVVYANADGHYTISGDTWKQIDALVFGLSE